MFHVRSRKLAAIFDDKFSRNDDIHNHNTKLNVHLHVPLTETNLVKTSVCYTGVTRWNYHIKFTDTYCSLDVYKKRLKIYFHNPQCKCKVSTIVFMFSSCLLYTSIDKTSLFITLRSVHPVWFIHTCCLTLNMSIIHPLNMFCTHFKQSCSENTRAQMLCKALLGRSCGFPFRGSFWSGSATHHP